HVMGETTEDLIENCVKAKEEGFNAIGHLSPFLDEPREEPYFLPYAKKLNEAIIRVEKIRDTLGNEVDLCLELHRRMKPGEAIVFAQKVGKYFPFFIEDPIVPDNFDSKIGRASCRERVWISVVGGAVKVTSRKKEEWHELMTE